MKNSIDHAFAKGAIETKRHTFPGMHGDAQQLVDCKNSQTLFEELLDHIGLRHIKPFAEPPYIALVDSDRWIVEYAAIEHRFCREIKWHFGQHVILQLKKSGAAQPADCKVRVLNVHMPTSMSTDKRKEEALLRCGDICTDATPNAPPQIPH